MRNVKLQISVVLLLLQLQMAAQFQYKLHITPADKDSSFIINDLGVKNSFNTRLDCIAYVNELPSFLRAKGFINASVDTVAYDSISARITLYVGDRYQWKELEAGNVDPVILSAIGWRPRMF